MYHNCPNKSPIVRYLGCFSYFTIENSANWHFFLFGRKLGLHLGICFLLRAEFQNWIIKGNLMFELDRDWISSYFNLQVKWGLRKLKHKEIQSFF